MPSNDIAQDYITLSQAAKCSPGRPSSNAIWRWCRKGIKARSGQRVRLGHIRVGGKIFTTIQNLESFFAAVAEADKDYFDCPATTPRITVPTSKQRQRSIQRAEARLALAGI